MCLCKEVNKIWERRGESGSLRQSSVTLFTDMLLRPSGLVLCVCIYIPFFFFIFYSFLCVCPSQIWHRSHPYAKTCPIHCRRRPEEEGVQVWNEIANRIAMNKDNVIVGCESPTARFIGLFNETFWRQVTIKIRFSALYWVSTAKDFSNRSMETLIEE